MSQKSAPIGVLLTNTGTPAAPTPQAVRRFLAQFLADQRVIDYPRWFWLPLLYGVILNTRPRRSARLYQRVWAAEGSPLLTIGLSLAEKLASALTQQFARPVHVGAGMRYGEPSIPAGLRQLRQLGVSELIVLPLFPQYSTTTSASMFDAVFAELQTWRWIPAVKTISDYHDHPAYLDALAAQMGQISPDEKILFSYHGIPQRYVEEGDPYALQCQRTTELLVARLGLEPESWSLAYQSRFGPEAWLQPYTDELLTAWGRDKRASLRVMCPGFAVDCLETIDEIGHEGRMAFQEAGGGAFKYIPALNDRRAHVDALAQIITDALYGGDFGGS